MSFRWIEVARFLWGTTLLTAPRAVLSRLHGVDVDRNAVVVTRILGARHLVQASLSGLKPSPEVIAAGVWVDSVHSLTTLGLAVVNPHRARGGIFDTVVAAAWAIFGWHDLATAKTTAPPRQRRRDQLAQVVLPRLPGGKPLWARVERARMA
ncbi:hypothetical protein [Mycobacterium noviomagense]|uniref:Uncharacterized protein n=1 Tax=Mycobacterium noviomagense TaxID=459858 RepID=A0A7I7P9S1_9MYCO|nr:hypothetical protein [Mycobacterium noviomagense]ORB11384.1 hypothetical protein BST37_19645 [Mycobacterium noviomagense]BBY05312.1 hypothetical protein MNVI_06300 [Mycobacterium noviomagense]